MNQKSQSRKIRYKLQFQNNKRKSHGKIKRIRCKGSYCGINDEGIKNLNLEKLNARNNSKITNINHMTKLKELDAGRNCGTDDGEIKNLNLEKLYAQLNSKIRNINHMTKLKELNADFSCGIDDK
jgi:hypothetical protein